MKKLNKKSLLFNISLVIITIIVLTAALIALGKINTFNEGIGARAFEIIKVYQEGENRLFYIDQAAKLSCQQAAYDLAQKGGSYYNPCGDYRNYSIWISDASKTCYPQNYTEEFKKIFNDHMRSYLSLLPSDKFIEISDKCSIYPYNLSPDINYEISFIGKNIVGIPNIPMQINLYRGEGEVKSIIGSYKLNPSFNIDIGYDINEYEIIKERVIELIKTCTNLSYTELISCVNEKAAEYNWSESCGSNSERVFNKFLDEYLNCISSKDTDCYCEIEYLGKLNNFGEDYEIILEKQGSKTKIRLKGYNFEKLIDYKMPGWIEYYGSQGMVYDDISYHIYYTNSGDFELVELEPEATNWDVPMGSPYLGKARLYKAKDGTLYFIDTDEYASEGFKDITECSMQQNFFKFCFESTPLLVKNIENKIKYEPISYKFAVYLQTSD